MLLVYPMIFVVTSISLFFRPARVAILPQLVEEDELVTANSALWVGETIADVIGFPIAGLFVVVLADGAAARVLAGRGDLSRLGGPARDDRRPAGARRDMTAEVSASDPAQLTTGFFGRDRRAGSSSAHETILLANTIQAAVAQFAVGILLALTVV